MGRRGVRSEWAEVPVHIRHEVEEVAGAGIVTARNIEGGFSPGPAARCDLDDGRTVFVKAAGTELNAHSPVMHRQEAAVLAALPAEIPAPKLIGVVDDGDWVALVISWVDGTMPTAPMTNDSSARVLRLAERLASAGRDSSIDSLATCAATHPDITGHWQLLIDEPLPGLDARTHARLHDLARLEADHEAATQGSCLVHLDLRTDNMIFGAAEADDVVVDWPGACLGADWIDLLGLLPSLHLDGGPKPQEAFDASVVGRAADAEAVDVFLASIAGYFTRSSLLPPPPGLPTVRAFQRAQGEVVRAWLRHRLGWG